MKKIFHFLIAKLTLAGLLLLLPAYGFAQVDGVRQDKVDDWFAQLERIENSAALMQFDDPGLMKLQVEVQDLELKIEAYKNGLTPRLSLMRSRIEKLGAPPSKDAPPESPAIEEERSRLDGEFKLIDGTIKRAGVAITHAKQLIRRVQELRREVFSQQLFKRHNRLFKLSSWSGVGGEAASAWGRFSNFISGWFEAAQPHYRIIILFGLALLYFGCVKIISLKLVAQLRGVPGEVKPEVNEPLFFHRAASAVMVSLLRMLPSLTTLALIYFGLQYLDALPAEVSPFLFSVFMMISIVVIVYSLVFTLLAPKRPKWRLLPVGDVDALRMVQLLVGLSIVYALHRFGGELSGLFSAPLSLTLVLSLLSSVVFTILLVMVLRIPFGIREVAGREVAANVLWPVWLKLPLWAVAFVILVSVAFGFFALAEFLAGQVVLTGAIVMTMVLIYMAISELKHDILNENSPLGRALITQLGFPTERRKLLGISVSALLNLLLFFVFVPLILVNWGFSWADMQSWGTALFHGFTVGSFRFSLGSVFVAILLFFGGVAVTRFIQRWLDTDILNSPGIQSGLSNSIRTGVGYLGFLLSVLLAVSYVGLDFTNLAIVAGALSVGIGFGLQSIVNNFVSGLILLVERPVKVGDWVIVAGHQGYVRRISVRSTEIETFDRSSVIVPNSELITGVVTNWTHGNTIGRVIVGVGVAYDSDPRQVYDLLLSIAKSHPKSLTYPAPKIVFEDFGASSLDFTIRSYIGNITEVFDVTTELRMMIFEQFKEQNIEIAFPQLDIHIKR